MLRVSRYAFFIVLLFIQLLWGHMASANESYMESITGKLKPNDSCVVIDDKFRDLPLNQWNQLNHLSVTNLVSFELRTDTSIYYYNKPFTCSLNVTIKYFTSRDQVTPTEVSNINLVVKYDSSKGSTYPTIAQYKFKNAFKVVVVVNSITSQEYGANIPAIFRLKSQILVDRRYPFTQQVTAGLILTKVNLSRDPNTTTHGDNDELKAQRLNVSWKPEEFPGSEEYDLEWTYIDAESNEGRAILHQYTSGGMVNIPDNIVNEWMRNDASRVTVKEALYEFPLPYQEGYILARARGVSIQPETNLRLTTNWVYRTVEGNTATHMMEEPYESDKNYQFTASFAEEGKRKDLINYFDGALKSRQLVTINNSDLRIKFKGSETVRVYPAVAAETKYDELGRPTLNVLPAPIKNDVLNYTIGLNQNLQLNTFSFRDITLPVAINESCFSMAGEMSTGTGASSYYSMYNQFLSNQEKEFDKYIPDAGKKPYTLTQYTADNTGRIRRSWAAGDVMQPGSSSNGHPTEYFYGKPTQKELDRLFGSEAGNASHYLKNMVMDPNGQLSVTYLDANGKIVATALAGEAPQNLEALPSSTKPESSQDLTRRIIGKDDFRRNTTNLSMQASAVYVAAISGNHTIYYYVNPLAVITKHNNNQEQFCSNCYYEIKIEVRDDCGKTIATEQTTPFTLNDVTCNSSTTPVEGMKAVFFERPGEYTITYTLQLSEQQIAYYTDHYIENNSDLFKLQDFFQKQLDELDLIGCYSSCESCKTLGTKADFLIKVKAILANTESFQGLNISGNAEVLLNARIDAIWEQLSSNCTLNNPCVVTNACANYLEQMKLQVRAGGQYAPYGYDEATGIYSLLEPAINLIPKLQITETPDLVFTTADGRSVNRKTLSISDLIKEYINHPEWADEIVKYHIEYCNYEWCKYTTGGVNNETSYNFDRTLREMVPTGQDAVSRQYFDRTKPLQLLNQDPFFNTGGAGAFYKTRVANLLTNYTAEHKIILKNSSGTFLPGKNINQYVDWMLYCRPTAENPGDAAIISSWTCNPSTACRSLTREWELYRNLYLQIKSRYVEIVKGEKLPNCSNCFIGDDPLGDDLVSDCTVPAAPCASVSQFTTIETNVTDVASGSCRIRRWDEYLVSSTGPVTERITLRIKQQPVGTNGSPGVYLNVTLEPGQSQVYIAQGTQRYGSDRRLCGDTYDVFTITEPVCETYPKSLCKEHPLRAAYANKTRVFMDYFDQMRYNGCEKPTSFDPATAEALAAAALRERLAYELENTYKPNWKEKLLAVKNEYAEFSGITEGQIDQIITGIAAVSTKYLNNARSKDMAIVNEVNPLTPPTATPYSFDAVFKQVLGNTLVEKGFSHYLLQNVFPFNRRPLYENETTGELNSNICNNLSVLKGRYTSSGFTGSFLAYLKQELGEEFILKQDELTDLETRCANSPVCRLLNDAVMLPGAFTAKALDPLSGIEQISFIDYTTYLTYKSQFATAFPGMLPENPLYQTLFASFINQKTGFIKSYAQLMMFEQRYSSNPLAALYNTPTSPVLIPDEMACVREQLKRAYERAGQEYDYYITQERKKFRNNYISTCLSNQAFANIKGVLREYHYTLYYYDQSGNLVKTIPPEGVRFLNDQECEQVDEFRNFPVATCDGTGIPTTTDKVATLTSISNLWNAQTSKSLEMWLYSGGTSDARQVRWVTTDKKYLFQAAISDQKLWMELYTLESTGTDVSINLSNQVVADISNITVQAWSHLVAQSTDFTTAEWNVYLDGKKLTLSNPSTQPTYPFAWEIAPGPSVPEDDLASLKHVRLYNRSLTDGEVAANFRNSCLSPVGVPAGTPMNLWARFNIPAPGSETTTGAGSTNEYVNRFIVPKHVLPSNYVFNSFNSAIKKQSPDAGTSEFWYDKLNRLIVSQNSEQKVPSIGTEPANRFSFTKYDALGRIIEVGEKISNTDIRVVDRNDMNLLKAWYENGTDRSLIETIYDEAPANAPNGKGSYTNVRNRVAAAVSSNVRGTENPNATYYSYDILGNAKIVIQKIAGLKQVDPASGGIKRLDYDYDLISSRTNQVVYQKAKGDQFVYKYVYDGENKIREAYTSRDENGPWNLEVRYSYYLHGPLARIELGQKNVQGIDYAYTLNGWLKAVNGNEVAPGRDMGQDGVTASTTEKFSRDELALTLGYFNGDYKAIGANNNFNAYAVSRSYVPLSFPVGTPYAGTGAPLFNGNITNSTLHLSPDVLGVAKGYTYRYDQLNRLLSANQHSNLAIGESSAWGNSNIIESYREALKYDGNGNILTYFKNGGGAAELAMDDLTYHYNKNEKGELLNNRLNYVHDAVDNSTYAEDIEKQTLNNYSYDKVGNLISDNDQKLQTILWNVYGKISSITKVDGTGTKYDYDAAGNRVGKSSQNNEKSTFYVRDPEGNVIALYDYTAPTGSGGVGGTLVWGEQHLFGSSRVGVWRPGKTVVGNWQYNETEVEPVITGQRSYELTNHLGNVLATISDKKIAIDQDGNGINDYFKAELLSVSDYYSFGMQMPERKWGVDNYRYGFNGQERSLEINNNSYTAEYWEYDSRVGRRWNVDPVVKSNESGYSSFANNPVWFTDSKGADTTRYYNNDGNLLMTIQNGKNGYDRAMVVSDDKVKAIQEYAHKNATVLNSGTPIKNTNEIDNYFKNHGDLYDLKSFAKFYEDNKSKYAVLSIDGNRIEDMTKILINDKPVSKDFLKNMKGAEAVAWVSKVNGIFTVDESTTSSDYDLSTASRPVIDNKDKENYTHIHLHPFLNKNISFWGKNKSTSKNFFGNLAGKGQINGSITMDIKLNNSDGRNRSLPRTVVVSEKAIRLITNKLEETIFINR